MSVVYPLTESVSSEKYEQQRKEAQEIRQRLSMLPSPVVDEVEAGDWRGRLVLSPERHEEPAIGVHRVAADGVSGAEALWQPEECRGLAQ